MYTFRLIIKDREYKEWEWKCMEEDDNADNSDNADNDNNADNKINTSLSICPASNKLFHNDVVDQSGAIVKKSPYRDEEIIHGILITSGKTYGRLSAMNKDSKMLYKCIPDDKTLPNFLITFEEKNIGFSKNKKDKYITFRIKEWKDKHPIGTLTNNYGNVDIIENYITYKMSCHRINDSLQQFNKIIVRSLRETTLGTIPYFCNNTPIEDRRDFQIISIDPKDCTDIDDALGIRVINGEIILSIYISNVPMMMEYLNLWDFFTNRVSTIYFPDKKLPMLPSILSDNVCSLKEGEDRVAFVLDVFINMDTYEILKVNHATVIIKVEKNYVYEKRELLQLPQYNQLKHTVTILNKHYKNVNYMDRILNSHDVVEYCMLLMNHECAKMLLGNPRGIFRSTTKKEKTMICKETAYPHLNYLLQNVSGEYCSLSNLKPHYVIAGGLECYTHITSPIRRMVDCIMMLELQQPNFQWSAGAIKFLNKWTTPESIDIINTKTKVIRKLENEIRLIELYEKVPTDNVYFGIVFGKTLIEKEKKPMYKYNVYIQTIKLLSYIKTDKELVDYTMVDISIHQFLDEAKMCKKIRLQLV
jgi:exoribonuclease R